MQDVSNSTSVVIQLTQRMLCFASLLAYPSRDNGINIACKRVTDTLPSYHT